MSIELTIPEKTVKAKMSYMRLNGLDEAGFPNLMAYTGAKKDGEKETPITLDRDEILEGLTAAEKTAGKVLLAGMERVTLAKNPETSEFEHDPSDVFV